VHQEGGGERRSARIAVASFSAKIERATENLALAKPEGIPGISKLLAGWCEQEANTKDKLQQARGEDAPSPEALEVIRRPNEPLERISEADREKLPFTIR
jgi:hypothetical protein